ncbi:unnamed protein product [Cuscuta epithymum]|uniref:DNA replication complex GINS protein PSF3 N-terminal domain-containing protein n=1 Tax=Cuscuta epithymum TaxID=186058 RepID=A0AAV0C5F8_9ASTE|nr:unnamed protein product [Cuscuta epithymum]CAH9135666.1 unnamed protein product [Cuscuta epithymum]
MTNYYEVDDILAEEELVPAVFQKSANGVGIFDCCDDTNKVGAGTEVEMPFWLACDLYVKQAVKIKVPSCFDTKIGDKTIGPFLLVAFRTRYKEVLIKAYTAASTVAIKQLPLLTQEEMKLYEAGQSSIMAFKKWRMGGPRLQKASVLGRKRKPTE